jgi:type IV secretory pathway ATPase VirB11/archaellum biosynthesis ATPase
MGPDGILMQELRDSSAAAFLGMLESGHWGMTTTHAASADDARDRIRGLVKHHSAGMHLSDRDIMTSLHRSIDLVVHCVRQGSRRYIDQVLL